MDIIEWMGRVTTVSSLAVNLVGVQICLNFVQKGNTGEMSSAPFLANFVNACVWLRYGILTSILPVIIVNGFSSCLNFIYISFFYVYTMKKLQLTKSLFAAVLILLTPLYYIKYYQTDLNAAAAHLGTVGTLSTIASYAAPLASLREVLKSKNTESMSFLMVLANFLIATEWWFYGYLLNDQYIQMPNFIGMLLGTLQLGLFLKYPRRPVQTLKV